MYDKNNLKKLKKVDQLAPDAMKAFWDFSNAALAEGAIPAKYKELIAVAVAHTTQCPYCIDVHAASARKAGATDANWSKLRSSPPRCGPVPPSPTRRIC